MSVLRLYEAGNPHDPTPQIAVREVEAEDIELTLMIAGRDVETITIPRDMLHSWPLSVVSDLYLRPVIEKHCAPI